MRKETLKIARAFRDGKPASGARTKTDGQTVWLHGNVIAQRNADGTYSLTLAGWNTQTTRERLNGIASVLGLPVRFYQKAYRAMVHDWTYGTPVDEVVDEWADLIFAPKVA